MLLEGVVDTPATLGGSGGAMWVSSGSTGDIRIHDCDSSHMPKGYEDQPFVANPNADPAISCIRLQGSTIANTYIETGFCASPIRLESCQYVHVVDCRITSNRGLDVVKDNGEDACIIHLTGPPLSASSTNVIRGNVGSTRLTRTNATPFPNDVDEEQLSPSWGYEEGDNRVIRIRVDPFCRNNHITGNMRLHGHGSEMTVWYPPTSGPIKQKADGSQYIPSVRTHTVGQQHVITYARQRPEKVKYPPTGPHANEPVGWHRGDIVFNSEPGVGKPVGWVFAKNQAGTYEFRPFGTIE